MSNNFINIIKEATEFYTKHKEHPAAKDELIGIVGEALEKMDEEEILSFDKWFFSTNTRKNLNKDELLVVNIISEYLED